jgi:hypothetical protein
MGPSLQAGSKSTQGQVGLPLKGRIKYFLSGFKVARQAKNFIRFFFKKSFFADKFYFIRFFLKKSGF